jgi:hypothetical protein
MNFAHQQATRLEVVYQRDEATGVHVERDRKGLLTYTLRPSNEPQNSSVGRGKVERHEQSCELLRGPRAQL